MDKATEIKQALIKVLGITPDSFIRGIVKDVQKQTCSVELASGLIVTDVKLKAVISDENDYVIETPVVGSDVLLTGSLNDLVVLKCDKVKKFEFSQNGLKVIYDADDKKVSIQNDQANLLDVLLEFTGHLKTDYKQFTSNGPTNGALPTSVQAITAIENKFKQLLK